MTDEAPTLELEQARQHAARVILLGYEKQGALSIGDLVGWLEAIGRGHSIPDEQIHRIRSVLPKLATQWEN